MGRFWHDQPHSRPPRAHRPRNCLPHIYPPHNFLLHTCPPHTHHIPRRRQTLGYGCCLLRPGNGFYSHVPVAALATMLVAALARLG